FRKAEMATLVALTSLLAPASDMWSSLPAAGNFGPHWIYSRPGDGVRHERPALADDAYLSSARRPCGSRCLAACATVACCRPPGTSRLGPASWGQSPPISRLL